MSDTPNIVQTALQAGRELAEKIIHSPLPNGKPILILRDAKGNPTPHYLGEEHVFAAPLRTERLAFVHDLPSFLLYWERYHTSGSNIYASALHDKEKLLIIINDHTAIKPDYADHRVVYELKNSAELDEWRHYNGRKFENSEAFAEFIERNLPDFTTPSGARMLEIASNLTINANAAYGKAVRLSDGNIQLTYTNDVNARSGEEQLPTQFAITIPVHAGLDSPRFFFDARLRVRLNNGKLVIWYELIRPQKVIDTAIAAMLEQVEKATGHKIIMGAA